MKENVRVRSVDLMAGVEEAGSGCLGVWGGADADSFLGGVRVRVVGRWGSRGRGS